MLSPKNVGDFFPTYFKLDDEGNVQRSFVGEDGKFQTVTEPKWVKAPAKAADLKMPYRDYLRPLIDEVIDYCTSDLRLKQRPAFTGFYPNDNKTFAVYNGTKNTIEVCAETPYSMIATAVAHECYHAYVELNRLAMSLNEEERQALAYGEKVGPLFKGA